MGMCTCVWIPFTVNLLFPAQVRMCLRRLIRPSQSIKKRTPSRRVAPLGHEQHGCTSGVQARAPGCDEL